MPITRERTPGYEVRLDFRACPHAVRGALMGLRGSMAGTGLARQDGDTLELVVAEVLNNVVEHAYADQPDGIVTLIARTLPCGVAIQVRDKGRSMPGGALPEGQCPTRPEDANALPEGGFGWFLIRDLAQDLAYKRVGNYNCLTFRLNFGRPEEA